MWDFISGSELLALCSEHAVAIHEVMISREIELSDTPRDRLLNEMRRNLAVMRASVERGLTRDVISISGLSGGDARKLDDYALKGKSLSGDRCAMAVAASIAVAEVNAAMGLIVAAPTAGASGILPGTLITIAGELNHNEDEQVLALFTAGAVGYLIARNSSISGAQGGCQAETGTAAAMAAAALVELRGGTPEMALHAAAAALKNVMGLVCDPVAGLVECPCIKRNALGAANALVSADMALCGIKSLIPFDEVVEAMRKVGNMMSETLRETALGGLATTPTALKIKSELDIERQNE